MRRKRNLKRICSNITEEAYKMLEDLSTEERLYLCQELEECIRGRYYSKFKSNKLLKPLTAKEKEYQKIAKINWLEGDSNE